MQSVTSIFTQGSEESDFMPDFEDDGAPFCGATKNDKVFNPKVRVIRIWQTIVTSFSFLSCIITTFMASFSSEILWLWVVSYIFDATYLVDIILNFYLAYFNHNGILVTDRRKIVKRYFRTKFLFDALSVFPTDLFALFRQGDMAWKILTRLRLNRLVQFYKTIEFFGDRDAELGSNTALIRGLKYTAISVWITHGIACIWHSLACEGHHAGIAVTCSPNTWANNDVFHVDIDLTNATAQEAYIESLYWAMATVTSTGYGDVRAVNIEEKWFSIFAMLMGIGIFFGMLLGGLTSMLTNFDEQRGSYVHRFSVIKENLKDLDCAEDLQEQVIGYYEYLWIRKRGVLIGDAYDVLPLTFKAEISHTTYSCILKKAHLFDGCGSGFLRMLSLNIKPMLFLPTQIIITKGDVGNQMYFVHRGEAEISLIYSLPRTATIRAATHCDLMVLEKSDLQQVLMQYPDIGKKLLDVAKQRCNKADAIAGRDTLNSHHSNVKIGNHAKAFQPRRTSLIEPASRKIRKSFAPSMVILEENSEMSLGNSKAVPINSEAIRRRRLSSVAQGSMVGANSRRMSQRLSNASTFSVTSFHRKSSRKSSVLLSKSLEVLDEISEEAEIGHGCYETTRFRLRQFWEWFDSITIPPNSALIRFWQKLVVVVTILLSFLYPYMACFTAHDERAGYSDSTLGTITLSVSYVFDFVLLADIIINLRTGIATPHGAKTEFKDIVEHYCHSSNFIYDVIAAFPLEIFCLAAADPTARWRLFAFLKLNRVIKVLELPQEFDKEEELMEGSVLKERSVKLLIYVALLSHWVSCVLYLVACSADTCGEHSWLVQWVHERGKTLNGTQPLTEYITSLYWATATMTSTGYGDITAHTAVEQLSALSAMLLGLLLYGYSLACLAATLANLDAPRIRFLEKIIAIKDFMKNRDLEPELQKSVLDQLKLIWHKYGGVWMPGQHPLMNDIPLALQQDIAMEDCCWILGQVPLFQDLDDSFLRMLCIRLVSYTFCPEQYIVYAGDLGREMYMIRRGICQYVSPNKGAILAEIGPGQYFGDLPMLFGDYHLASVRAKTHVEVLELKMSDLLETLQDFPLIKCQFEDVKNDKEKQRKVKETILNKIREEERNVPDETGDFSQTASGLRQRKISSSMQLGTKTFSEQLPNGEPNDDYLQPYREVSRLQRVFSKLLMKRTFLPGGVVMTTWQRILIVMPMIIAFTIPLQIAFLHNSIPLWIFHIVLDIAALVCLYLGFHMSFHNNEGILVTHPLVTARNYLHTTFFLDLISCFPFELFFVLAYGELTSGFLHTITLIRIPRLLQLYRIPYVFIQLESTIEKSTDHIRAFKFCIYIAAFMNLLTCGFFLIACPAYADSVSSDEDIIIDTQTGHTCLSGSWINRTEFNISDASLFKLYTISFYFATATSVSVGYGDIWPTSQRERVVSLLFMMAGVLFFGYVSASIAANLANADTQRANFQKKLDAIKHFLEDQQICGKLQEKVIGYYEYVWRRTRGVQPEHLFDGMPQSLWGDVTFNLYGDILSKMALMKDADKSFIKMLSKYVTLVLFRRGDYVVRKHDIGSDVYFIHQGVIEVVSEDGVIVFDTLSEGSSFGEDGWLFASPRSASFRAKTNCDLFMLTKEALDFVLDSYPEIKEKITRRAEGERNKARKMSQAEKMIQASHMRIGRDTSQRSMRSMGVDGAASLLRPKKGTRGKSGIAMSDPANIDPELTVSDLSVDESADVTENVTEMHTLTAENVPQDEETQDDVLESFLFPRSLREHQRRLSSLQDDITFEVPIQVDDVDEARESTNGGGHSENRNNSNTEGIVVNDEASTNKNGDNANNNNMPLPELTVEHSSRVTAIRSSLTSSMTIFSSRRSSIDDDNAGEVEVKQGILGRLRQVTVTPTTIYYRRYCDLMCLLGFLSCWLITYDIAFQNYMPLTLVVHYIIDVLFIIEIAIKCRLSYYNNHGDLVDDPKMILDRYLKTWHFFAVDALAALPLDIFALAAPEGRRMIAWTFLRSIHLLRYVRVSKYFSRWEKELDSRMLFVRTCKFTVIFVLVIHVFSCTWYITACPLGECQPDTWASQVSLGSNMEFYCTCIYWCIATMTSTGYGDIHANNEQEMWVSSFAMMTGKLLFGLILANIASTLAHAESQRVHYEQKLISVKSHMHDQEVPKTMQKRVIDYYNYLWVRSRGEDVKNLFKDAPYCLQSEIYLTVMRDMLEHIPLLDNVEESFLRHICLKVRQVWFLPGDYIVMRGDMGREMYYIHRGEVEVVRDDGTREGNTLLGPGDIFGEVSIVCSVPRRVTVRAKTHVDVFTLSKMDLDSVLQYYSHVKGIIGERAKIKYGYIMEQMKKKGARRVSYW